MTSSMGAALHGIASAFDTIVGGDANSILLDLFERLSLSQWFGPTAGPLHVAECNSLSYGHFHTPVCGRRLGSFGGAT